MGFFDFITGKGKKVDEDNEAEAIKKEISDNNATMPIENLNVFKEDDVVSIDGLADNQEDVAKAVLIAGNIKGVSKVIFDEMKIKGSEDEILEFEEVYYDIVSGDNLSKIAKKFYGNGNKYMVIFNANKEVIKDPDKIYIGQKIRIPNLED